MKRALHTSLPYVALLLGILPLATLLLSKELLPAYWLLPLNFVAWLSVALAFINRARFERALDEKIASENFDIDGSDLEVRFSKYLDKLHRLTRASLAFQEVADTGDSNLSRQLREIAKRTSKELKAEAVELALVDSESGQKTQSIMIGIPKSGTSRVMALDASQSSLSVPKMAAEVVYAPVRFAGYEFGSLCAELPPGHIATPNEERILKILALQGAMLCVHAQFTDVLLRMKRHSEESLKAKTGFLANLSHEIRGPLGTMLNGVELLSDGLCGEVNERQLKTLSMIKNSGEHLLDLVNDVLDYAKVEAGKIATKPVDLSVKSLLEDLSGVVRSQAISKGHRLVTEEVDAAWGIVCDKRHSRQMIINFLTNAIKYTPEGGTITIGATKDEDGNVRISVTDTGVGIPEESFDKVFGAFERVDDPYSNKQMGSGLGMPLTVRLAEVNGGSVGFESEVGKGSTFWVSLPYVAIEKLDAEVDENGNDSLPLQGNGETILLVEHDKDLREMLVSYLTHHGFEIHTAVSGMEVLKILKDKEIDLAVVENDMPDLPGEEVISVIRSNPKSISTPLILLSAKAFVFDIERFLKLGVDRCLSKPVPLAELAFTARRLIDETKRS